MESSHGPDVELDLKAAVLAREVEANVKTELARVPLVVAKSILEGVAVDLLAAIDAAKPTVAKPTTNGTAHPTPRAQSVGVVAVRPTSGGKQWEQILSYCQAHPTSNGKFRTADITEALLPDKAQENRNVAMSTIYTSVKRRSVGESDDPCFVWLGNGIFRLATDEERTKAREGAK